MRSSGSFRSFRSFRALIARVSGATLALSLASALSACSAAPERETQAVAGEAVTSCPPGSVLVCGDEFVNGKRQCWCDDQTRIASVSYPPTGVPAGGRDDTCGSSSTPIPSGLANRGCTLGIVINGDPIWACPSANASLGSLPATFGVIHYADGTTRSLQPCSSPSSGGYLGCEAIGIFTHIQSNCLGDANAGWVFVWDHEANWGGSPQGCTGSCPVAPGPQSVGDTSWH